MNKHANIYDVTLITTTSLKKKLVQFRENIIKKQCFLGWDGYVDSLYSIVRSRDGINDWSRMESMKEFGEMIQQVAGSSAGLEGVLKRKTLGGFTSNICKGMNALGAHINLISAWGFPEIDDLFISLADRDSVKVFSYINPGKTIGLEFSDGKIMITDFGKILNLNWQLLIERVSVEKIVNNIETSHLMGFGYWAPIPNFDNIMQHLLEEIFPSVSNLKDKLCFIDLADIKKRNKKDINKMVKILKNLDEQVPLLLSLNDQEAIDLSKALNSVKDINIKKDNLNSFVNGGKILNDELNIAYLVIHSPHFSSISTQESHYWITQCFTSNPQFTTSAGDHFNAGTALGLSCNLTPPESIMVGNALTSIFIRTGISPTFEKLSGFIHRYEEYLEEDIPNFP